MVDHVLVFGQSPLLYHRFALIVTLSQNYMVDIYFTKGKMELVVSQNQPVAAERTGLQLICKMKYFYDIMG